MFCKVQLTWLPAVENWQGATLHCDGNPASHHVVAVVALDGIAMRVECLTHEVNTRFNSGDVNPLTVQVTSVHVSAVRWYPLSGVSSRASILTWVALNALCVLETKRGFVTLCNLFSGVRVYEVEVDKRLKGVVVVMTVMIDPLITAQVREEWTQSPVVCEAGKPQKCSENANTIILFLKCG